MILKRPDNFDELDDARQAEIKQQSAKSTLSQETGRRNPRLSEIYDLDHGKTRRLPVELAGDTCDDDILPFREALINVQRHWKELGDEEDCLIHFMGEELKSHRQDAEGWNEVQDFFDGIDGLVI